MLSRLIRKKGLRDTASYLIPLSLPTPLNWQGCRGIEEDLASDNPASMLRFDYLPDSYFGCREGSWYEIPDTFWEDGFIRPSIPPDRAVYFCVASCLCQREKELLTTPSFANVYRTRHRICIVLPAFQPERVGIG